MTTFHNQVGTAALTNWVSPQSQQIAFGRGKTGLTVKRPSSHRLMYACAGTAGFVAINNVDSAWSATFATSLADGTYCDVVSGPVSSTGACAGSS